MRYIIICFNSLDNEYQVKYFTDSFTDAKKCLDECEMYNGSHLDYVYLKYFIYRLFV